MKIFLIILVFALGNSEQLDRTYLPPPGSKFAGGSLGAIDVPFKLPKEGNQGTLQLLPSSEREIELTHEIKAEEPKFTTDTSSTRKHENPKISQEIQNYTFVPITNIYEENLSQIPEDIRNESGPVNYNELYSSNLNNYLKMPTMSESHDLNKFTQEIKLADFGTYNEKPLMNIDNKDLIKYSQENIRPTGRRTQMDEIHNGNNFDLLQSNVVDDQLTSMPLQSHGQTYKTFPSEEDYVDDEFTESHPNKFTSEVSGVISTPKKNFNSNKPETSEGNIGNNSISEFPSQVFSKKSSKFSQIKKPQVETDRLASILNYRNTITPNEFTYNFDTSNGIHVDVNGTASKGVKVQGSYSYIGDDGKVFNVTYTADENGFRPKGDHLPTAPPIPEAILKVIEQVTKEKDAGYFDDGSYDANKYGHKNYQTSYFDFTQNQPLSESPFFDEGADIPKKPIVIENISGIEQHIRPKPNVLPVDITNITNSKEVLSKDGMNRKVLSNVFLSSPTSMINNDITRKIIMDRVPTFEAYGKEEMNSNPKHIASSQMTHNPTSKQGILSYHKMDLNDNVIQIPSFKHHHNKLNGISSEKSIVIDNGYMYKKPDQKFDFKITKSRFSESEDYNNNNPRNNKDEKPKPFITPNVSRDYEDSEEDEANSFESSTNTNEPQSRAESINKYTKKYHYDNLTYKETIGSVKNDNKSFNNSPHHKQFETEPQINEKFTKNSLQNIHTYVEEMKTTSISTTNDSSRIFKNVQLRGSFEPEDSSISSEFLSTFDSSTPNATYSIDKSFLNSNKLYEFPDRKLPSTQSDGNTNNSILGYPTVTENLKGDPADLEIDDGYQSRTNGIDEHSTDNSLDENSTEPTATKQNSFDGTDSAQEYMIAVQKYNPRVTHLENYDSFNTEYIPLHENYKDISINKPIGEDFSGPKQVQKFDPNFGYYY